jgi:hypothetical protein
MTMQVLYIARNTWTIYKAYWVLVATGEVQGGRALARENAMSGDLARRDGARECTPRTLIIE